MAEHEWTDERVKRWTSVVEFVREFSGHGDGAPVADDLLLAVDARLRRLEAVARRYVDEYYFENFEGKYRDCQYCGADDTRDHAADCLVVQARGALEAPDAPTVPPGSYRAALEVRDE